MRILSRGVIGSLVAGFAGLLVVLSFTPVGAASANVSRSYKANGNVTNGNLVSLDSGQADYIELADVKNGSRLLGVALSSNDSLIAFDATEGKIQVATSGTANVLVSTLGGPIGVGDEIGVSPFSGIGMKATAGSRIIGLSQTSFDKGSEGAVKQTVTDKAGKPTELTIGYVRLTIAIATDGSVSKDAQLSSLQRFVQGLTGHTVPTFRVVISLIIALAGLLILVTLIYSSIYGGIISIGRNPLAKYAVFRTLGTVIGMALLTGVMAGVSIFLLLR